MNSLTKPIYFTSIENAKSETGYFAVSTLSITLHLSKMIRTWLAEKRLITWHGQNTKGSSSNLYTLNFIVRSYRKRGANSPSFDGLQLITSGGRFGSISLRSDEEEERLEDETPTIERLYIWIARKYPEHLLGIACSFNDPEKSEMFSSNADEQRMKELGWS